MRPNQALSSALESANFRHQIHSQQSLEIEKRGRQIERLSNRQKGNPTHTNLTELQLTSPISIDLRHHK